jgi:hypothetical protein
MSGLVALIVAELLLAAAAPPSPDVGTFSGIGVAATGTVLTVSHKTAAADVVTVAQDVVVRERLTGGDWKSVSLAALKLGEPIVVQLDAAGRARQVDAEYAIVRTRAVVFADGYLIGTDGGAYKLTEAAAAVTAIPLGAYVKLRTDPLTGYAFDAEISTHPFADAGKQVRQVAVTFEVRVPINTPPSSTVYLATNSQNWTPNAIRLAPEPGNKWTATVDLAAGSVLQYKYTRGSWSAGETDSSGSQIPNRTLTVVDSGDAQRVNDSVIRWADLPS